MNKCQDCPFVDSNRVCISQTLGVRAFCLSPNPKVRAVSVVKMTLERDGEWVEPVVAPRPVRGAIVRPSREDTGRLRSALAAGAAAQGRPCRCGGRGGA